MCTLATTQTGLSPTCNAPNQIHHLCSDPSKQRFTHQRIQAGNLSRPQWSRRRSAAVSCLPLCLRWRCCLRLHCLGCSQQKSFFPSELKSRLSSNMESVDEPSLLDPPVGSSHFFLCNHAKYFFFKQKQSKVGT